MNETAPVQHFTLIADVFQALDNVHKAIDTKGFDRRLHHLVQLRASQINGCAYCVKMHTREARNDGETNDRLDRLIVWPHVPDFTSEEKAALAWTEALTVVDARTDYAALRSNLRLHFNDGEIGTLTAEIAMINLWNRFQVSNH